MQKRKIIFYLTLIFFYAVNAKSQNILPAPTLASPTFTNEQVTTMLETLLTNFKIDSLRPTFPWCEDKKLLTIEESFNQCVKDVCKSESELENYNDYLNKVVDKTASQMQNIPEDFKAPLLKEMNQEAKYRTELLKELKRTLAKKDFKIDPRANVLHTYAYSMLFFGTINWELVNGKYVAKGFKEDSLKSLPYTLSENEKKWILDINRETDLMGNLSSVVSDPEAYLLAKYPQNNLSEAVKKEADDLKSSIKNLKMNSKIHELFPNISEQILGDTRLLDKVLAGYDLKKSEIEEFVLNIAGVKFFINLMTKPENYPLLNKGLPIDFETLLTRAKVEDKINGELADLQVDSQMSDIKKNALEDCYANYLLKNVLPNKKQKEIFEKNLPELKKKFKQKTLSQYSEHSAKVLAEKIDKLSFQLPEDASAFVEALHNGLKGVYVERKQERDAYTSSDPYKKDQYRLFYLMDLLASTTPRQHFQDILDACHASKVETELSDATETISGKVFVSWQSLSLPLGESVIFHEIGHNVFAAFRNKNLSETSSQKLKVSSECLNSMHPELSKTEGEISVEKKYTDEDFADLLSSIASSTDDPPFTCHFIAKVSFKIPEYSPSRRRYIFGPLKNGNETDPHSSEFFRLLHVTFIKKGIIPTSCQEHLTQIGAELNLKNCF